MGACGCAETVEKGNEMSLEEDEIKRRMHMDGSNIDSETLSYLIQNMHHIIRIQATFKGHMVRKRIARRNVKGSFAPKPF